MNSINLVYTRKNLRSGRIISECICMCVCVCVCVNTICKGKEKKISSNSSTHNLVII